MTPATPATPPTPATPATFLFGKVRSSAAALTARGVLMACLAAGACLSGCGRQERVISITSEPPGAVVWLNDYEIGRTPVETEFAFFGVYDIRLHKEGYEPLITSREAEAPYYEYPGVDLIATALPGTRATRIEWSFVLAPLAERGDQAAAERDVLERARTYRTEAEGETLGKE